MGKSNRIPDQLAATAMDQHVLPDGGLAMLKEYHRKDALEVATGKRSARSLWVVGKGDLQGARFTLNPASEFAVGGVTWR